MNPDSTSSEPPVSIGDGGGVLGAIDLSDPLRDVFLDVIKVGEASVEDLRARHAPDDPENVKIYLDILVRQNKLEKFKDENGIVRYRPTERRRPSRKLDDDIWDALAGDKASS